MNGVTQPEISLRDRALVVLEASESQPNRSSSEKVTDDFRCHFLFPSHGTNSDEVTAISKNCKFLIQNRNDFVCFSCDLRSEYDIQIELIIRSVDSVQCKRKFLLLAV